MINLTTKPSPVHKLVFGEQDIGRLDLPYDNKFKDSAPGGSDVKTKGVNMGITVKF